MGQDQVMAEGGSGFCFKRRASESCSEEDGSISKHLRKVHLSDVQAERKHGD